MTSAKPISEQIARFMNQLIFMEKKGVFRYGDVTLYPSELHLMFVVAEGEAVNATAMAERLGVTKGAVSQTISRLARKKMVVKTKDSSKKNELTVHFTPQGEKALQAFTRMRAGHEDKFLAYLGGLSDAEQRTIQAFLHRMDEFLEGLR